MGGADAASKQRGQGTCRCLGFGRGTSAGWQGGARGGGGQGAGRGEEAHGGDGLCSRRVESRRAPPRPTARYDNDGYGSPRLPIPPCHPPQVEALAAEASRWLVDDDALWGCAHAFRLTANRLVAAAASERAASSEHRRLVGGACSSARATATAVLRSCCSADSPVIGTDTGAIVGHHDTAALLGGDGGGGTTMGEVPANRFEVWSGELLRRHETLLSGTVWREEYGVLTSGGTLHLFDAAGVVVAKDLPPASPLLSLPCAAARIEREGKRTGRCPQ